MLIGLGDILTVKVNNLVKVNRVIRRSPLTNGSSAKYLSVIIKKFGIFAVKYV